MRTQLVIALAGVLAGDVLGQANRNIPGPTDYPAFSRFVTDRNIFDPNRQPHYTSTRTQTTRPRTRSASTPTFTLVGTMAYEKGFFAFFSGNDAELKKVLLVSEKIADYTVTEITAGRARIESADGKQKLELKVGDVMHQEAGGWQFSGSAEIPPGAPASETGTAVAGTAGNSSAGSTPGAPVAAGAQSEILKRLMEKRAKENQ
ncbi:MAG: hypothetical protein WCH99_17145 [Verrucomicrobiota bacterium]